jgi:hypothetical protein
VKWRSFLVVILILALVSCGKGDEAKDQRSEEPGQPPERQVEPDAGDVVSKREITLTEAAPAPQPEVPTVRQSEQQGLLALESVPVLPEDFEIGPLAELVSVDRSTLEMISVATRFLNGLVEGSVAEESLHAEIRRELATSIRYYLERGLIPLTYRIGAITTESYGEEEATSPLDQRTAWMNLRLFGSPGVSSGELYLERSGGRWYVSDLQLDFEQLGLEYTREQDRYYPSTYGWGIQ